MCILLAKSKTIHNHFTLAWKASWHLIPNLLYISPSASFSLCISLFENFSELAPSWSYSQALVCGRPISPYFPPLFHRVSISLPFSSPHRKYFAFLSCPAPAKAKIPIIVAGKVFICYYILDCVIFIAKLIILILQWSATVLQYSCIIWPKIWWERGYARTCNSTILI